MSCILLALIELNSLCKIRRILELDQLTWKQKAHINVQHCDFCKVLLKHKLIFAAV